MAYWKVRAGDHWASRQAAGRCVNEEFVDGPNTTRRVDCRPFAADRSMLSDRPCAVKVEGQACEDFTHDRQGTDGTCTRKFHTDHGDILTCDTEQKPTPVRAASSGPVPPAPPRPVGASKASGCGCGVPGRREPASGVGLVGVMMGMVVIRRFRSGRG